MTTEVPISKNNYQNYWPRLTSAFKRQRRSVFRRVMVCLADNNNIADKKGPCT